MSYQWHNICILVEFSAVYICVLWRGNTEMQADLGVHFSAAHYISFSYALARWERVLFSHFWHIILTSYFCDYLFPVRESYLGKSGFYSVLCYILE